MYQPLLPAAKTQNFSPINVVLCVLCLFAVLLLIFENPRRQEISNSHFSPDLLENAVSASDGDRKRSQQDSRPSPVTVPGEAGPSDIGAGVRPPVSPRGGATSGRGSARQSPIPPQLTTATRSSSQAGPSGPRSPAILSQEGSAAQSPRAQSVPLSPDTLAERQEDGDEMPNPETLPVNYQSSLMNPLYAIRSNSPAGSSTSPNSGAPLMSVRDRMPRAQSMENFPQFPDRSLPQSHSDQQFIPIVGEDERPRPPSSIARVASAASDVSGVEMQEIAPYEPLEEVSAHGSQYYPARARCGHEQNGYEVRVGYCSAVDYHYAYLTWNTKVKIPLVLDRAAECGGQACEKSDKWTCCKKRPRCLEFNNHVPSKCPEGTIQNPYEYAFCRRARCSVEDVDRCCVAPKGVLFERLDKQRSDKARIMASDVAPFVEPHISFAQHKVAWVDFAKKEPVDGEFWAPLVNFMDTWGSDTGWTQEAWIKLTRDGKMQYRDLELEIHSLTCEHTLDDFPEMKDEQATYIIHCPRMCLGQSEIMGDQEYYRWKVARTKEYRKKGLPLYASRDSEDPALWGKFTASETFVSKAFVDARGDTVWTEVKLQSDGPAGRFYWLPTIVENDQLFPPFKVYTNQLAHDVKGCGGMGFLDPEWFSSDSPICVAARVLNMLGGERSDDFIELTVGPKQASYKSCTNGGIETASLADTSSVQRSYRLGQYGFEMMRKSASYIQRSVRSLWQAHTEGIRREGPGRVFLKWGMKGLLFYNLAFPISGAIDRWREPLGSDRDINNPAAVLVLWALCFIKPIMGLSISITIDTTIDWFHPRTRLLLTKGLDLGPSESVRTGKIEKLGTLLLRQMKTQYHGRIYLPFVALELGFTALAVLKITTQAFYIVTARMAQLEILNRLKRAKNVGEYPDIYPPAPDWFPSKKKLEESVGMLQGAGRNEPLIEGPEPIIDFSPAFINKIMHRIRDLLEKITPKEGEQPVYSRLDVLGWMSGLDLSKIQDEADMQAALDKQMEAPNCILNDFSVGEDGTLEIGTSALPALANNLGIDWEIRQLTREGHTILYFALTHEDIASSAQIMNKVCPFTGSDEACPNIQIRVEPDDKVLSAAAKVPQMQKGFVEPEELQKAETRIQKEIVVEQH